MEASFDQLSQHERKVHQPLSRRHHHVRLLAVQPAVLDDQRRRARRDTLHLLLGPDLSLRVEDDVPRIVGEPERSVVDPVVQVDQFLRRQADPPVRLQRDRHPPLLGVRGHPAHQLGVIRVLLLFAGPQLQDPPGSQRSRVVQEPLVVLNRLL